MRHYSEMIKQLTRRPAVGFFTLLLCMIAVLPSPAIAANITVKVDRNPVMQDETFHIIYETDTDVDDKPDFSAIYKNFDILNSSQSTNMQLINGKYSMKKSWDLTVIGNKTGTFTIPSIPFGKDSSPALRIKVAKNADDTGKIETAEIFVEVQADTKSAYVGSEIIFTARLVRSIEISQGQFSAPETSDPDAMIIELGNIPQYTTTRKGKRYIVNEVRYAVYPQHSGKLTFEPLLFQARISSNNSRSLFDQFLRAGEIKRIRSKKLSVDIKAKPANIKADEWLPAKKLSISEEWSDDLTNINVGEPITRTITINADGFTAEQLPELDIDDLDKLKLYPDQAVTENTKTADGISALKQIKVAIIPTQAGNFTLPEITIPWWNTKSEQMEIAKIPKTTITAIGSASNIPILPATPEIKPQPIETSAAKKFAYWPWLSFALAAGWLLTIVYMIYRNKTANPGTEQIIQSKAAKPLALKALEKAVQKACRENNTENAKKALIQWARAFWQTENINSLADIAKRSNSGLGDSITQLNSALYGSDSADWDGGSLLKEFNHFRVIKRYIEDTHTTRLEPLYK